MPMLVDDRQMQDAMRVAASRPFEGVDPGFGARFLADFEAMQNFSNSNASHRNALAVQNDFQSAFWRESGQRLPGWVNSMNANAMELSRQQFEAWKKDHPDSELVFPTPEVLREKADAEAAKARRGSEELSRRSTGSASAIGGFLGTAAGALSDPINMMTLGFGGAGGIIRTALTEAAIGVASESIIQASSFDRKKRIDPSFGGDDALFEIGAAGAGGAIIGGGIKGLAAAWHRAKTGQWPSSVRDAGTVLTREAAVPNSRFERSVRGEAAHQAAVSKALDDLINSRPVELPPEAFAQANARPGRVYDADGNSVGVRYEVVDANELVTSHNDDLSLNPAFPQELQPRDRSRAMSQDQIAGIAGNLQPERLGFSSDAGTGAPIVGADGLVESGNGRVLALRRAYQQDGVPAANYRNYLRSQNFEVDGIANPVLIARRVTDLEDRVGFVTAANRSTAMRLGAAEQALSDGRLIDTAMLDALDGPDIKAAANQGFSRGFMAKLPRAEQGSLVDKDGFLSQEGERRITAALMGRAYGEPVLLGRALEDTDNNIKSIAGALADSSGPWSKLRDAVSRGDIPAGMDITDDLLNAVRLVMKARDEGRSVKDLVNQAEMFGGPDELSKIVARAMFSDADLKRPIGRAKLAAFLRDYADEAMKNDAGPRLLGEPLQAPEILKSSLERVGREDLMRVAEERLTPEAVDRLTEDPATIEATIMDAERLIADNEERQIKAQKAMQPEAQADRTEALDEPFEPNPISIPANPDQRIKAAVDHWVSYADDSSVDFTDAESIKAFATKLRNEHSAIPIEKRDELELGGLGPEGVSGRTVAQIASAYDNFAKLVEKSKKFAAKGIPDGEATFGQAVPDWVKDLTNNFRQTFGIKTEMHVGLPEDNVARAAHHKVSPQGPNFGMMYGEGKAQGIILSHGNPDPDNISFLVHELGHVLHYDMFAKLGWADLKDLSKQYATWVTGKGDNALRSRAPEMHVGKLDGVSEEYAKAPSEFLADMVARYVTSEPGRKLVGLSASLDRALGSLAAQWRKFHNWLRGKGYVSDSFVDFMDNYVSRFGSDDSRVSPPPGEPSSSRQAPLEVKLIMIDIGDGRGERPLRDILDEADEEIGFAKDIQACTVGSAAE